MAFSIGKNEIKNLQEQKQAIDKILNKFHNSSSKICNFSDLVLSKKRQLINNKIIALKYMIPSSKDDKDDSPA